LSFGLEQLWVSPDGINTLNARILIKEYPHPDVSSLGG
jgi:hypothetical protein